ncbi:MAG: helix-turn-helix domain-containing protein [Propionibacteriaceae bacterium]|jgi:transcriptional regulator with XRE-family HTH domain|nr:helix-turn-helix domain-containing protein [Propionibacteriaceae bacterium]
MAVIYGTTDDLEREVGRKFRALRLQADVDQVGLAKQANVSLSALKNLEAGRGSSLRTLIRVARALDKLEWLLSVYEEPEISPMAMLRAREGIKPRQRASRRKGE